MNDLFIRFSAIYGGLWTHDLDGKTQSMSKKLEWFFPLSPFSHAVIHGAIDLCKLHYDKPPSIKQFRELCESEQKRMRPSGLQIDDKSRVRMSCSPLLAGYMANNPVSKVAREETMTLVKGLLKNTDAQQRIERQKNNQ